MWKVHSWWREECGQGYEAASGFVWEKNSTSWHCLRNRADPWGIKAERGSGRPLNVEVKVVYCIQLVLEALEGSPHLNTGRECAQGGQNWRLCAGTQEIQSSSWQLCRLTCASCFLSSYPSIHFDTHVCSHPSRSSIYLWFMNQMWNNLEPFLLIEGLATLPCFSFRWIVYLDVKMFSPLTKWLFERYITDSVHFRKKRKWSSWNPV